MTTDDERREVATRLRNNASQDMDWLVPWAVFNDAEQHDSEAVVRRLADLIEPSEPKVKCVAEVKIDGEQLEQLIHDAAVELTGIDREALMALADEMDRDGRVQRERQKAGERWFIDGLDVMEYARRIREALGVDA